MIELIGSTLTQITKAYSQYAGSGIYMMLFFISLIYINIWERQYNTYNIRGRRSENNILLFQYPLVTLAVIFNPLIAVGLIALIGPEVYWRIFWILPVNICIAYTATVTIIIVPEKARKVLVTAALLAIMILCGRFVYSGNNYILSSNLYKVPPQTVQVCNFLENDSNGAEIRVAVPPDLVTTVRQYDAKIQMPYGRGGYDNTKVENVATWRMFLLLLQPQLDVYAASLAMTSFECNYLVINKTQTVSEDLEKYGFQFAAASDSFNIYRFNPAWITAEAPL